MCLPAPGTTRDIVEVSLTLGGVPVVLADTAGIREAGDEIEREGVRRALKRASEADIRLHVTAFDTMVHADESIQGKLMPRKRIFKKVIFMLPTSKILARPNAPPIFLMAVSMRFLPKREPACQI